MINRQSIHLFNFSCECCYPAGISYFGDNEVLTLKKTLGPLLMMDGDQLPQGYSHFEEAVYFLPLGH